MDNMDNVAICEIVQEQELTMEELVDIAYTAHKNAYERWPEGNISEYWMDDDGYLCIRYESGEWFHYKDLDLPFPTWW